MLKNKKQQVSIDVKKSFMDRLNAKAGSEYKAEWESLKSSETGPSKVWKKFISDPRNRYEKPSFTDQNLVAIKDVDFFNGNFVKNVDGAKLFVATQAPTLDSVEDFWKVVVQENINVMVMLCKPLEPVVNKKTGKKELKEKCAVYWPTDDEALIFDNFEIHFKQEREQLYNDGKESLMITKLEIVSRKSKKLLQKITHLQFRSWEDFGVPGSNEGIMEIYKSYVVPSIEKGVPALVHCSAGIGRTGSFVAGYYCYQLFLKSELVSVSSAVKSLRRMRAHSIQTAAQYIFAHLILIEFIENDKEYKVKAAKQKVKKLLKVLSATPKAKTQ